MVKMQNRKRKRFKRLIFLIVFITVVWLNNASFLVDRSHISPTLLAHRGLAQTFDIEGVKWDTDTSKIIHEPVHPYLENTIASMQAAFDCGADIVELDVHPTKDGQLAVFHDYLLDYRTNGTGLVSDYTMGELKQLDIGYGYTADGGKSFPFRGKAVGQMPSIDEVFEAFPYHELLIHVKDGGVEAAMILDSFFQTMPEDQLCKISVYGSKDAVHYLKSHYPNMKTLTKSDLMQSLILYELFGWTGYVPKSMHNAQIHLPIKYAPLLWGWPNRFLDRMDRVGTRVVVVQSDGTFSSGFDDADALAALPEHYSGTIWTDRIDLIAPIYK
jgi:glycerophosphoryl diester phosphodiesterase